MQGDARLSPLLRREEQEEGTETEVSEEKNSFVSDLGNKDSLEEEKENKDGDYRREMEDYKEWRKQTVTTKR